MRIYQLKFFPEGFSGGFAKSRRPQIKGSFDKAIELEPPVWIMVTPRNATVQERKFLTGLRGIKKVRIEYMGPAELDGLLAKHPDLQQWASRNEISEALSAVNRESASLARPRDLQEEVARTMAVAAARSEYWRVDVAVEGDQQTHTLVPTRPDSHLREPISFQIDTAFGQTHEELRAKLEDVISFGALHEVQLPSEVVKNISLNGPSWVADSFGPGEVRISPTGAPTEAVPVTLTTLSVDESRLASISGLVTYVGRGRDGNSVRVEFPGGLTQVFRFSERNDFMQSTLDFRSVGHTARTITRALDYLRTLPKATRVEISIGGDVGSANLKDVPSDVVPLNEATLAIIADMAFLEKELNVDFAYPAGDITLGDAIWLRVAVRLVQGRVSFSPVGSESFTATLSGVEDAALESVLTRGGPGAISADDFIIELFGTQLNLGTVSWYSPSLVAVDGAAALESVRNGTGAGRQVALTSATPFRMYRPDLLGPDTPIVPEPWGLPGVDEHSALQDVITDDSPAGDGISR